MICSFDFFFYGCCVLSSLLVFSLTSPCPKTPHPPSLHIYTLVYHWAREYSRNSKLGKVYKDSHRGTSHFDTQLGFPCSITLGFDFLNFLLFCTSSVCNEQVWIPSHQVQRRTGTPSLSKAPGRSCPLQLLGKQNPKDQGQHNHIPAPFTLIPWHFIITSLTSKPAGIIISGICMCLDVFQCVCVCVCVCVSVCAYMCEQNQGKQGPRWYPSYHKNLPSLYD